MAICALGALGRLCAALVGLVVGLLQLNSQLGVKQVVGSADLGADLFRLRVIGAAVADGFNLSLSMKKNSSAFFQKGPRALPQVLATR